MKKPFIAALILSSILSLPLFADVTIPIVSPEKLGGPNRDILYVSTDKPIYRTGETVYIRAVGLNAHTNFPMKDRSGEIKLEILGPRGEKAASLSGWNRNSTCAFGNQWQIPASIPGGTYKIRLTFSGLAAAERSIEIRAYNPPKIKSQIVFLRDGYRPGEVVSATVSFQRAEGGIPEKAVVTAFALLDGRQIAECKPVVSNGTASVSFKLPEQISEGEGSLTFRIQDGGIVESASKTIPVILDNVSADFYPEGGDLVAGLPTNVYVQFRMKNGKPAAPVGTIEPGNIPVNVLHEGRGIVQITPKAGVRYEYVFPSGRKVALPDVKEQGGTIQALRPVSSYDSAIRVRVNSTAESKALKLMLCKRENILDSRDVKPGVPLDMELEARDAEGVLTVTLYNEDGIPLAERLIFRKPKYKTKISWTFDKKSYSPGDPVAVTIHAEDEKGSPVSAVLGVAVTDDSLLEMVDKREQAPSLPVMVYVENEVDDLADAHVYLDESNPDADRDLDLLLGTQGWRRFILVNYDKLVTADPDPIKRVLGVVQRPRYMGRLYKNGRMKEAANLQLVNRARNDLVREMADAAPEVVFAAAPNERLEKGVKAASPVPAVLPAKPAAPVPEVQAEERAVAKDAMKAKRAFSPSNLVVVREYAHKVRSGRKPNDRQDFTETIYWNPSLETNPRTGNAVIKFDLPDSITAFRLRADSVSPNGALGEANGLFESLEPFRLEPKMPLYAVAGDRFELPVALINSTTEKLNNVNRIIRAEGLEMEVDGSKQSAVKELAPGERARDVLKLKAVKAGSAALVLVGAAGPYADTVTRKITVIPAAFPLEINKGGMVGPSKDFSVTFRIPDRIEAGSMATSVKIYTSPLASMQEALQSLLRHPHGCFEQASSTNYPVVMVREYYGTHQNIPADDIQKADSLMKEGLAKLVSFESREHGYEWFGGNPGHEALTAYGLMQFCDMSKYCPVDPAMLARTKSWLMSRRDGNGGFKRNAKSLDSFGRAPEKTTNAYILWALLESGEKPESLENEINSVLKNTLEAKDSYLDALALNIAWFAKKTDSVRTFADRLKAKQEPSGRISGAETTITCSGNQSKDIETASLAILGFLRAGDLYAPAAEDSMRWLIGECKNGRFGSTQSTILALKAINAYDKAHSVPAADGSLQLCIDGVPFGKPLVFTKTTKGTLEMPDFSAALTPGSHTVTLKMTDGAKMPASFSIQCAAPVPDNAKNPSLTLKTTLSDSVIEEGKPLTLTVEAANVSGKAVTMPFARIGIPSGLELRHDRLKELVKEDRISAYEVSADGELVLYWRAFKDGETVSLKIPLTAVIPGTMKARASRIHPYYAEEDVLFVPGTAVTVKQKVPVGAAE